jgi:hypothetical protein
MLGAWWSCAGGTNGLGVVAVSKAAAADGCWATASCPVGGSRRGPVASDGRADMSGRPQRGQIARIAFRLDGGHGLGGLRNVEAMRVNGVCCGGAMRMGVVAVVVGLAGCGACYRAGVALKRSWSRDALAHRRRPPLAADAPITGG